MYKKRSIKSLLMKKLYSKEEERVAMDNEKILRESLELSDLEKEVLKLDRMFDLEKFLHGDSEVETGVCLITPFQSLCIESRLVESDNHGYNFQILYDAIYDGKVNILPIYSDIDSWQTIVMDNGNIAIQLTCFGDVYVWCPGVINKFQLRKLQELNEKLKKIDVKIKDHDYLQHLTMDVHGWVRMEDGEEISVELDDNTLDYLLDMYHYDSFMGEAEFKDVISNKNNCK